MSVEMNKPSSIQSSAVQDIKKSNPTTELYVGQLLKAVVISSQSPNEVQIQINGQDIHARTAHQFNRDDVLDVKVVSSGNEIILEVQNRMISTANLQAFLLQYLPKQAPATFLFHLLSLPQQRLNLSSQLNKVIGRFMDTIIPLYQLPNHMKSGISQCGLFFESNLYDGKQDNVSHAIPVDFKGQCLKLLSQLTHESETPDTVLSKQQPDSLETVPLPLPGVIPQPLVKSSFETICDSQSEMIPYWIKEELSRVLARITAHQIHHLIHKNQNEFVLMLDFPVRTLQGIDVIPILIQQHPAKPLHPSQWSLSFALNLSRLGALQGVISISSFSIDIKLNVAEENTIPFINQYQSEISQSMSDLGLNLRGWAVQLGLEKNQVDTGNLKLLDIRI